MKALIAEDDATSRVLLTALLGARGFEVVSTSDGAEAWALLQQPDAPKLIVLDWMMPYPDGPELCRRIRRVKTNHPPYIILLTTRDAEEDIVSGLNAGANDYVSKPYHPNELRARLDVGKRLIEAQAEFAAQAAELQVALAELQVVRRLLPVCARCRTVRNDREYREQLDKYLSSQHEPKPVFGLCPACLDAAGGQQ